MLAETNARSILTHQNAWATTCHKRPARAGSDQTYPNFYRLICLLAMQSLSEDEVRKRLEPLKVIAAIEAAFRDRYQSTIVPLRSKMELASGVFLIMPCYDFAGQALGMKLALVQNEPETAMDRVQATYMLLDPKTARPTLVVPANYLTDLRTAATSAVATKFLAKEDARVLGIVGTGRQARAHIQVLPLVRRFEEVLVSGRNAVATHTFAEEMSMEIGLPVRAVDSRTCAANSEVLCTCTTSPNPLFDGSLLRSGAHLNLVGAFRPHAREVDSASVQRSRVFVETYPAVFAEAGDLLIPIQEGVINREDVAGDLHHLVSGKIAGRTDQTGITLFKSVGYALEDLATAELLTD